MNSSKGNIRDRNLKDETAENIKEYLENQGVTHVKRFQVKKGNDYVNTNTLLLTFDSVVPPKTLKIFYQIIDVDLYVPNPLRCFNCQKFGHHEDKCPVDIGSVCERCGTGGHDHHVNHCKNPVKCVNCGGAHSPRSNECEIWKQEKAIMKLKVTKNLTYLEARKLHEQKPEFNFSTVVKSLAAKPETKTTSTQFHENDFKITESSKVITARKPKPSASSPAATSQTQTPTTSNIDKKQLLQNAKMLKAQQIAPSRIAKGSDDPIKEHNKFGALMDDESMDMEEVVQRHGARGPPRSPIKAPK